MLRALFSHTRRSGADVRRSGSTRQRRLGVISVALGLLVPASFAIAGPADAHTPWFGVSCTTATVDLTNYQATETNTITVTAGGQDVIPTATFKTEFHQVVTLPAHTSDLDVTFTVTASDDPTGAKHWATTETQVSHVCDTPSSSSSSASTSSTSQSPTSSTSPTSESPSTSSTSGSSPSTSPSTSSTTQPPTTTTAAPPAAVPTATDLCGTNDDTFTVPEVPGVAFYIGEAELAPGTYAGSGSVTIEAFSTQHRTLAEPNTWTFTWTDATCLKSGTALVATANDVCGTTNDTYTIPVENGDVSYTVNSTTTAAGTYAARGTVTIVAVPAPGYVLVGPTTWTFTYTNEACLAAAAQNGLANTGSDLKVPLLAGGLLLIVGGGLLYGARRRS